MKTLYIARHAKSSWKEPELADIDRPLNKRGKKNAPFMGTILKEKGVLPDLIVTSPAKRAKKTCFEIADKIGYKKSKIEIADEIYEASTRELIQMIREYDDKYESVMMFGHNPSFTMLNNQLSDRYIDNIPTCGISAITFNSGWKDVSEGSGKSEFFIYPKLYV